MPNKPAADPPIARPPNLGPLDDLAGYHLRRASVVVTNDWMREMAGTGLRQVPFGILSVIAANPGINQGQVGSALGVKRANMVSLMTEMLDAGLVVRVVAPDDRRAFVFTLTDAGRAALEDALARIRDHENRLLAGLSDVERALLVDLLRRVEMEAAKNA